jgi:hypothetical protein
MNNKAFALYVYQRSVASSQHLPPKLNFAGRWSGADLVMDDKGTVASTFLADGSLNPKPGGPGPARAATFTETQWWFRPCGS